MYYGCPDCHRSLRFKYLHTGEWLPGLDVTPLVCPFCGTAIIHTEYPIEKMLKGRLRFRPYELIMMIPVVIGFYWAVTTGNHIFVLLGGGAALLLMAMIDGVIYGYVLGTSPRYTAVPSFSAPSISVSSRTHVDLYEMKPGQAFRVIKTLKDWKGDWVSVGERLTYVTRSFDTRGFQLLLFKEHKFRLHEEDDAYIVENLAEYLANAEPTV